MKQICITYINSISRHDIVQGKGRIPAGEGKTCRERKGFLQEKEKPAGKGKASCKRRKDLQGRKGFLQEKEKPAGKVKASWTRWKDLHGKGRHLVGKKVNSIQNVCIGVGIKAYSF